MDRAREQSGGVFLTRGSRLVIPAGSLVISVGADGVPQMSMGPVHLSRNMTPAWLEIGISHLAAARAAHDDVLTVCDSDDQALAEALEAEFRASMQAFVAAATAMDALYASAKDRIELPPSLTERWRANGTARWRQVAEVLRRVFRVPPGEQAELLRRTLRELYKFRDMAVHPSAAAAQAVYHPDLKRGADWRFVSFSYDGAVQCVWAALAFTFGLASRGASDRDSEGVTGLREDLVRDLQPFVDEWESLYGDIHTNPRAADSA